MVSHRTVIKVILWGNKAFCKEEGRGVHVKVRKKGEFTSRECFAHNVGVSEIFDWLLVAIY